MHNEIFTWYTIKVSREQLLTTTLQVVFPTNESIDIVDYASIIEKIFDVRIDLEDYFATVNPLWESNASVKDFILTIVEKYYVSYKRSGESFGSD